MCGNFFGGPANQRLRISRTTAHQLMGSFGLVEQLLQRQVCRARFATYLTFNICLFLPPFRVFVRVCWQMIINRYVVYFCGTLYNFRVVQVKGMQIEHDTDLVIIHTTKLSAYERTAPLWPKLIE